jgi:hypothetical protein
MNGQGKDGTGVLLDAAGGSRATPLCVWVPIPTRPGGQSPSTYELLTSSSLSLPVAGVGLLVDCNI